MVAYVNEPNVHNNFDFVGSLRFSMVPFVLSYFGDEKQEISGYDRMGTRLFVWFY